ncbi:cupredoxin domain-containing protein [Candidatus Pelagibacter sp.]|nr:cupredoxin domain-containing protein [Candidatus Pelagibacter sp.]
MKKIISFILWLVLTNNVFAASMNMIGEKGNPNDVDRIIYIKMYDNYYEPNLIKIQKGETIKFVVQNLGEMVHEYNIATKEMHIKHQPEMQKLVEHGILLVDKIDMDKMKKMSKMDHSLSHSHSNSVIVEPKKTGEIIWKFSKNASLEIACNVPGHYETGMVGKIILE